MKVNPGNQSWSLRMNKGCVRDMYYDKLSQSHYTGSQAFQDLWCSVDNDDQIGVIFTICWWLFWNRAMFIIVLCNYMTNLGRSKIRSKIYKIVCNEISNTIEITYNHCFYALEFCNNQVNCCVSNNNDTKGLWKGLVEVLIGFVWESGVLLILWQ